MLWGRREGLRGPWPNEEVGEMLTCLLDVGVEGGGRGPQRVVVSEAHSTLIHKVGNTTPSSAVSSAFYFMGDCTVCLSAGILQATCSSCRLLLNKGPCPLSL